MCPEMGSLWDLPFVWPLHSDAPSDDAYALFCCIRATDFVPAGLVRRPKASGYRFLTPSAANDVPASSSAAGPQPLRQKRQRPFRGPFCELSLLKRISLGSLSLARLKATRSCKGIRSGLGSSVFERPSHMQPPPWRDLSDFDTALSTCPIPHSCSRPQARWGGYQNGRR